MKTTINTFAITIILSILAISASAKTTGTFKGYTQITDKEILIESTKGVKVLFRAFDNNNISFEYFEKNETISLITPANILSQSIFDGSMYVEELDELIQITTTTDDGLVIKIDTRNFEFTFIDKATNTEVFETTDVMASRTISTKTPKELLALN